MVSGIAVVMVALEVLEVVYCTLSAKIGLIEVDMGSGRTVMGILLLVTWQVL